MTRSRPSPHPSRPCPTSRLRPTFVVPTLVRQLTCRGAGGCGIAFTDAAGSGAATGSALRLLLTEHQVHHAAPEGLSKVGNSALCDELDCFHRESGQVSQGRGDLAELVAMEQTQRRVPQPAEDLRAAVASYAARILTQHHILHPMQLVLDAPVTSRQLQHPTRQCLLWRQ